MKNSHLVPFVVMLFFTTVVFAQDSTLIPLGNRQLYRIDPKSPHRLQEIFQPTGKPFPFVSAHHGGAQKGFPENCIETFEHALDHSYAILEIDPRYTQDGQIVIHHDPTLERTTTGHVAKPGSADPDRGSIRHQTNRNRIQKLPRPRCGCRRDRHSHPAWQTA